MPEKWYIVQLSKINKKSIKNEQMSYSVGASPKEQRNIAVVYQNP